ncbi:hypothetical protein EDB86DRAFT_2872523 [Lactarius hatsudake]|nr:hypothetical protein EDB86DRAFT_2872523 [Lactarius hatsudake]
MPQATFPSTLPPPSPPSGELQAAVGPTVAACGASALATRCPLAWAASWSPCVSAGSVLLIKGGNCDSPLSAGECLEGSAFKPSPKRPAVDALTDLPTGSVLNHPQLDLLLLPVAEPEPPPSVDVPSTTWGCSTPGDSTGTFDCKVSFALHLKDNSE